MCPPSPRPTPIKLEYGRPAGDTVPLRTTTSVAARPDGAVARAASTITGATVGDVFYFPLARTVMGGLISASVLTLIFLPSVSNWMEGVAGWLRRIWRASEGRGVEGAVIEAEPAVAAAR
jgi:hypothetical protein